MVFYAFNNTFSNNNIFLDMNLIFYGLYLFNFVIIFYIMKTKHKGSHTLQSLYTMSNTKTSQYVTVHL